MTRGLSVRGRLLLATVGVLTLALAIGVTAFNLFLGQRLSVSATTTAKAQAEAELSSLRVENGRIISPKRPDDAAFSSLDWVYQGRKVLEEPRAGERLRTAAAALAGAPRGASDLGDTARMYALPVVRGHVRYGTVITAVPLRPYRETAQAALVGSVGLAALLLTTMTALSWWMLGRALLPVTHMTESAAQWSDHDLDQRFNLGNPRNEFTQLAATLDSLLERIAESLRHEQRFTAEISHELRTPLARIKGETELLLSRPRTPQEQRIALDEIARSTDEMTTTVDTLVSAARHEAGLTQATTDLRDAVRAATMDGRGTTPTVHVTLPDYPIPVAAEPDLLTRILQPLVDNARRYGHSRIDIEIAHGSNSARIDLRDDGPGVRDNELEAIFEPGRRGSAARGTDGAGLGLPLARRLARSIGGEVTAVTATTGSHFCICLPTHPLTPRPPH